MPVHSQYSLRGRRKSFVKMAQIGMFATLRSANGCYFAAHMSETAPGKGARLARKLVIDLSIMTLIGIVLAVIGPFGTVNAPMATRLLSWIGLAWLGYCIYNPMGLTVGWLHAKLDLPQWALWTGVTLLATIPMAIAVWSIGFLPNVPRMPTPQEGLAAYINVLAIGASITVLFILIERGKRNADAVPHEHARNAALADPAPEDVTQFRPRFFERLPLSLGTDLIALEMEDHYVRAHTAMGSDLILLRMRDAVAELDGLDGAQVHRSWWVARAAVQGTKREGRNIRLLLNNNLEAPVSRAAAPALKEAGWF